LLQGEQNATILNDIVETITLQFVDGWDPIWWSSNRPISFPLAHRWQRNTLKVSVELVQLDKEIQNKDISSQTKTNRKRTIVWESDNYHHHL
jgi:hypothetical protein